MYRAFMIICDTITKDYTLSGMITFEDENDYKHAANAFDGAGKGNLVQRYLVPLNEQTLEGLRDNIYVKKDDWNRLYNLLEEYQMAE